MTFVAMKRRDLGRRNATEIWRSGAAAPRLGYYHFYLLGTEGRVYSAASMHCHDDIDALEKAPFELQRSAWYPVIEVWHGRRLVERIGARLAS